MSTPDPRPPLPPGRVTLAAALLESGLLLTFAGMFLSGQVQRGDEREGLDLPIRLGVSAVPALVVIGAYAVLRLTRPLRGSFVVAGALVCGLSAALRAGIAPLERLRDGLIGLIVGALVAGLVLPLDGEARELRGSTAQPWRELLFASFLLLFGSMPAGVAGGFLVATPTIALGLWTLGRGGLHDLRQLWRGDRRTDAVARLAVALPIALLGLGLLVVTPLLSLGRLPAR